MNRELTYAQALCEATDICLARDPNVYLMGLGVPDPKGTFGTTSGLAAKYGARRVLDMPTSENGMTGVAIGSALVGMRPIMTHQRVDFAVLAMEQIVNQAAKWHYMFGGQSKVPMVIRMVIGRGWGQGPQHSQSLQSWFAHIPGLKVVMPATPHDAKGLLIAAVEDDGPVIFLEHRWLHGITGPVPEGHYTVPLGRARIIREGRDVTIAAASYMTMEALQAAEWLAAEGISAEVVDVRSIRPLDDDLILASVRRTGRLVVADTSWRLAGIGAEILARTVEECLDDLLSPPRRVALPDCPTPTSPALAKEFYPRAAEIVVEARASMGRSLQGHAGGAVAELQVPADVPNPSFAGPF